MCDCACAAACPPRRLPVRRPVCQTEYQNKRRVDLCGHDGRGEERNRHIRQAVNRDGGRRDQQKFDFPIIQFHPRDPSTRRRRDNRRRERNEEEESLHSGHSQVATKRPNIIKPKVDPAADSIILFFFLFFFFLFCPSQFRYG